MSNPYGKLAFNQEMTDFLKSSDTLMTTQDTLFVKMGRLGCSDALLPGVEFVFQMKGNRCDSEEYLDQVLDRSAEYRHRFDPAFAYTLDNDKPTPFFGFTSYWDKSLAFEAYPDMKSFATYDFGDAIQEEIDRFENSFYATVNDRLIITGDSMPSYKLEEACGSFLDNIDYHVNKETLVEQYLNNGNFSNPYNNQVLFSRKDHRLTITEEMQLFSDVYEHAIEQKVEQLTDKNNPYNILKWLAINRLASYRWDELVEQVGSSIIEEYSEKRKAIEAIEKTDAKTVKFEIRGRDGNTYELTADTDQILRALVNDRTIYASDFNGRVPDAVLVNPKNRYGDIVLEGFISIKYRGKEIYVNPQNEFECRFVQSSWSDRSYEAIEVSSSNGAVIYDGLLISDPYGTPEKNFVDVYLANTNMIADSQSLGTCELALLGTLELKPGEELDQAVGKLCREKYDDALSILGTGQEPINPALEQNFGTRVVDAR